MSKTTVALSFVAGVVVALTSMALAMDRQPKTLQQCASILPSGKFYNFQVSGTIDMTSGTPEVRGLMQVDDGTKVDRTKEFDQEAFGACVASFLGE